MMTAYLPLKLIKSKEEVSMLTVSSYQTSLFWNTNIVFHLADRMLTDAKDAKNI